MRRVVVTGIGIVSPIGNNTAEVTESLKEAKSGINFFDPVKHKHWRKGQSCITYSKHIAMPTID